MNKSECNSHPKAVNTQGMEIVQFASESCQITMAISAAVAERPHINFIEHSLFVPKLDFGWIRKLLVASEERSTDRREGKVT